MMNFLFLTYKSSVFQKRSKKSYNILMFNISAKWHNLRFECWNISHVKMKMLGCWNVRGKNIIIHVKSLLDYDGIMLDPSVYKILLQW